MKAISLTQPWATLVALGAKRIETRSWRTGHRGPLAIHAAAGLGRVGGRRGLDELCSSAPFAAVLRGAGYGAHLAPAWGLPLGAVVAVVQLVDCVAADQLPPGRELRRRTVSGDRRWLLTDQERAFGDYAPGRFGWLLADVQPLPQAIPARGARRLWEWGSAVHPGR